MIFYCDFGCWIFQAECHSAIVFDTYLYQRFANHLTLDHSLFHISSLLEREQKFWLCHHCYKHVVISYNNELGCWIFQVKHHQSMNTFFINAQYRTRTALAFDMSKYVAERLVNNWINKHNWWTLTVIFLDWSLPIN